MTRRCAAVVITGAGRAFSAGGDVKGWPRRHLRGRGALAAPTDPVADLRQQEEISRLLAEMPKPTICALNGVAAGAGMSVALVGRLPYCQRAGAFVARLREGRLQWRFRGTWLLQRLVGPAKGEGDSTSSPNRSARTRRAAWGSCHQGRPARIAHGRERWRFARRLAAGPTLAFGRMKHNFAFGATNGFGATLEREARNMIASGPTEDHQSAARAFVEKREPEFVGR